MVRTMGKEALPCPSKLRSPVAAPEEDVWSISSGEEAPPPVHPCLSSLEKRYFTRQSGNSFGPKPPRFKTTAKSHPWSKRNSHSRVSKPQSPISAVPKTQHSREKSSSASSPPKLSIGNQIPAKRKAPDTEEAAAPVSPTPFPAPISHETTSKGNTSSYVAKPCAKRRFPPSSVPRTRSSIGKCKLQAENSALSPLKKKKLTSTTRVDKGKAPLFSTPEPHVEKAPAATPVQEQPSAAKPTPSANPISGTFEPQNIPNVTRLENLQFVPPIFGNAECALKKFTC